jgi:hypothetical protein
MKTALNEINAAEAIRAMTVITTPPKAADGVGEQHPVSILVKKIQIYC